MTPDQRQYFTAVVFNPGHKVGRTQAVWHEAAITGDTARMRLDIRVNLISTGTGSQTQVPLSYNAVFAQKNGRFALVALNPTSTGK